MMTRSNVGLLVVPLVLSLTLYARAQIEITSFDRNGQVTWTGSTNFLNYTVEWGSSLTGTWSSSWIDQRYVYPTNGTNTASVPMFYRVKGYTSEPPFNIMFSSGGTTSMVVQGTVGLPVPADFDGDGTADPAVYNPDTGVWRIHLSSNDTTIVQQWGMPGALPVPADYDGDGRCDIGVFLPCSAEWFIDRSTAGSLSTNWGTTNGTPAPADYDGDGKADPATY